MLMAGLDGIQNKIMPPDPMDKDLYDLEPEDKAKVKSTPGSLEEVLDALEKRSRLPAEGGRFHARTLLRRGSATSGLTRWIAIRLRPHPYEFAMYFDI